jgi:hypothetical protein
VARDRETGVGQIMATTPLTPPLYLFGKWLSNFGVLLAMVMILATVGDAIQLLAGESGDFDFPALLAPFLFVSLPMLALTAALAVLFESIGFLQGGFGNLIFFILFASAITVSIPAGRDNPALDPVGFHLLQQSMGEAAKSTFPDYGGEFVLGNTGDPITGVFHWSGVDWTFGILLNRFLFVGAGIALALVSAIFFDRFDTSHNRPERRTGSESLPLPETLPVARTARASASVPLTPLNTRAAGFVFGRLISLELKLLLKGMRWWWFLAASSLIAAALVSTPETVRSYVLPITWLWPILSWSGLGSREVRHNTKQMVFSSAGPLRRQLPAAWMAGFIVAAVTGIGAALKLWSVGDVTGLLAWFSGALFIPSLALALGIWSNSSKLFEVIYVSLWYLIINGVTAVDYLGANSDGNIEVFIPLSLTLIAAAFIGRTRQIQN